MGNPFSPSRKGEGQRDLAVQRPSRSGVGLRGLSHPQPRYLPRPASRGQAGGES